MTYGSSHRMCESNVHTYSNPYVSARLASSIDPRAPAACICRTTPNFIGSPGSRGRWCDVDGSGQRLVTTLVLVKKLTPSGPYMCVSPNRLAFQPPKL